MKLEYVRDPGELLGVYSEYLLAKEPHPKELKTQALSKLDEDLERELKRIELTTPGWSEFAGKLIVSGPKDSVRRDQAGNYYLADYVIDIDKEGESTPHRDHKVHFDLSARQWVGVSGEGKLVPFGKLVEQIISA